MWLCVMFNWVDYISYKVLCDCVLCLVGKMWLCVMFGWVDCISSKMWCDQLMEDANTIVAKHNVHFILNLNAYK